MKLGPTGTLKATRKAQRLQGLLALSIAVLLFLGVCVGVALADPSGEGESASVLLPEVSPQALEEAQPLDASPVVDPLAAEELPHSGLDRAEAEKLLTSVFPALTEEASGIFSGLEVEEFRSDHVAVMNDGEEGETEPPALLESLLPLRTESQSGDKEQVDLELEPSSSGLTPVNPLVSVHIPDALGEGIALPEAGIQLTVVGAPEDRAPSIIDGSAGFFPNIAPDTDLVATPTPLGVETITQLRSPQAPTSQTFALKVPQGAKVSEGSAGLTVMQGEEVLAAIPQPTAVDAAGASVPVSSDLDGNLLTLKVEPTAADVYPLALDPYVETFAWTDMYTHYEGWYSATNSSNFLANTMGIWGGQYGLNLKSTAGTVAPDTQANWNYYVPRYFSDYESLGLRPTSYIDNLSLSGMYFWFEDSAPYAEDPMAVMGIWDGNKGAWANSVSRTGAEGQISNGSVSLPNKDHVTDVKSGGIALLAAGDTQSRPRHLWVPQASVEITDNDSPGFASGFGPSPWLNQTVAEPITFSAPDSGLGMYSVLAKLPKAAGGNLQTEQQNGCSGSAASPCPRTWSGNFTNFNPAAMAQGEDVVELTAKDPIGHLSTAKLVKVKVDHTTPGLALSGNLTEQATVGTKLPSYTLNYSASDGDQTLPAATAPLTGAGTGTGTGQMQRPMGVAVDASGNIWMVDRENNRVEEFDKNGSFIRQFGAAGTANGQFSSPQGIAVSPAGNVWVTDPGNKRVQEFNEKGEFIRSATYAGGVLGQGKMAEPYAVATGPSETLWVGDVGSHRVYQFQENGTFIRAISSTGPLLQETSLTSPAGIAIDRFGDAYVAEQSSNQILEIDSSGKYVSKFSGPGTGQGQLSGPVGLTIAASGNILVADGNDNRIEEFQPDGSYLRTFASLGSEAAQLKEPRGIASGPENTLYIADAGNHRIAKWTHADKDPQSGVAKVEVKVDGATARSEAPGCSTKNCQINNSWALNADNYSVGSHKVEVIATDAVGLATTKTLTAETHGDLAPPSVALSDSMTEQATLGTTRPSYKLKLSATDPGSTEERKSGVASTTIKVDGKVVDTTSPGCPAEGCSIIREWTLESSAYSAGAHTVEAIAVDAAGHTTTKTLPINIERDTTAPQLSATGELYVAPEGWIEQKEYNAFAAATDENGYGVTSLELKIDGTVAKSSSGACGAGGCSRYFFSGVSMSKYSGGAHPAELIATDGAGNKAVKRWTINVDPKGTVPVAEAEDTLEAVEGTGGLSSEPAPVDTILKQEQGNGEGSAPDLQEVEGGGFESQNTPTPSTVAGDASEGFEVETTAQTSDESVESQAISVHPVAVGGEATSVELSGEAAAVSSNTGAGTDTVVRPMYDGLMAFQAIREATSPEEYEWEVLLGPGETLQLIDSEHAGVYWEDGTLAMLIAAQPAHGANGESVPVTLSVGSGNIVTESVHHKSAPVVYPVVAGVGWLGGFESYTSEISEPDPETEEEGLLLQATVSPPIPVEANDPEGASASSGAKYQKRWAVDICPELPFVGAVCDVWKMHFKGFFYYNYLEAWYPNRDPVCEPFTAVNYSIDKEECAWVGPNHQPYEAGYHITARTLFKVTEDLGVTSKSSHKHVVGRAFGDGLIYFHDTDKICNPSRPDC